MLLCRPVRRGPHERIASVVLEGVPVFRPVLPPARAAVLGVGGGEGGGTAGEAVGAEDEAAGAGPAADGGGVGRALGAPEGHAVQEEHVLEGEKGILLQNEQYS